MQAALFKRYLPALLLEFIHTLLLCATIAAVPSLAFWAAFASLELFAAYFFNFFINNQRTLGAAKAGAIALILAGLVLAMVYDFLLTLSLLALTACSFAHKYYTLSRVNALDREERFTSRLFSAAALAVVGLVLLLFSTLFALMFPEI